MIMSIIQCAEAIGPSLTDHQLTDLDWNSKPTVARTGK